MDRSTHTHTNTLENEWDRKQNIHSESSPDNGQFLGISQRNLTQRRTSAEMMFIVVQHINVKIRSSKGME